MKFSKFLGFGPVVPDGLGIGYNVVASKLGAVISSNKVNFKYFWEKNVGGKVKSSREKDKQQWFRKKISWKKNLRGIKFCKKNDTFYLHSVNEAVYSFFLPLFPLHIDKQLFID